jgi:hypothetical protein
VSPHCPVRHSALNSPRCETSSGYHHVQHYPLAVGPPLTRLPFHRKRCTQSFRVRSQSQIPPCPDHGHSFWSRRVCLSVHFEVDFTAGPPSCSWKSRLLVIYKATKQHAFNLAKFVSLYKILLLLQRKANGGKQRNADTFIAGLLGGYVVFGDRSAVNEQVLQSHSCSSLFLLTLGFPFR